MIRHIALAGLAPALALSSAAAWAKDAPPDGPFQISGSIRARVEGIDGQFRPSIDDTAALLLRADLLAEYDAGPVRIGGELQDARVYFEHRHSSAGTTEVDALEPVQAYLVAELAKGTELKGGRFTLDLGSRRLISRQNFRNSTNAFTGARFDWHPAKGDGVTLFWTMPQNRLPSDIDGIQDNAIELDKETTALQLFGGDAAKTRAIGNAGLEAYAYRLVERDTPDLPTRNRRLWTIGARLYQPPRKASVDFDVEGAWQSGHERGSTASSDVADLDVSAYFVHASAGYTFAARWSPRVAISYDAASGDGPGGHYARFDTLYGARAFEFGPTSFYGAVSRANLSSPEIRLEVKPDKRWDGYVAARALWLAKARDSFAGTGVKDANGQSGRYAGVQIDGRARYWLVPDKVRLGAGAALLAKGRFLTDAPNAPRDGDTHYGYFEVNYSF